MHKLKNDLLIRHRFPVPPQKLVKIPAADLGKVAVRDQIRLINAVHIPSPLRHQILFRSTLAQVFHLRRQRRLDRSQTLRNSERKGEILRRIQIFQGDLTGRRHPIKGGQSDAQSHLLQQCGGHGRLPQQQANPHGQGRLTTRKQLLAMQVKLAVQMVALRVMLKLRQ